ncbi:MAG: L-threonylcarbamoyladenylate synthase [Dermatophilus congolensis]|nr:L-threonylcarbamoyladenylate synthase [Dermatophilus congolensis]
MSEVVDATVADNEAREQAVATVADAVQRGEVVVIPTDTVYGVGADAFDADAVRDLLDAKGRGRQMPPPVLVPDKRTLDGLSTAVPSYARRLVEKFWPGPLTLVLQAQSSLMWDLGDTNGTVAVRMPDCEPALAVLAITGPMAVTSANRTGEPAATTVEQAREQLGDAVSVYLDGGPSVGGLASTIVDCTGDDFVILREGGVTEAELRVVAFPPDPDEAVTEADSPDPQGGAEGEDNARE